MILLAKYSIFIFALFLIFVAFLMFFKPYKTKEIIGKAGSTYLINYGELGIRFLIGIAFVWASEISKYPFYFEIIGYFLMASALVLMALPIQQHNQFSKKAAASLQPIHLKVCALFSVLFGILLLTAF